MATVKLMLDQRSKGAKKFPLVIKVSHKQLPKNIQTGYKLSLNEWDEGEKKITRSFPNSARANSRIQAKLSIANQIVSEYQDTLKRFTVYDLVEIIEKAINEKFNPSSSEESEESEAANEVKVLTSLFSYGEKQVELLKKAKQHKYAFSFVNALSSFKKFANGRDIAISEINESLLMEYEAFCKSKDIEVNSYGVYLRSIRRIINLAIKDKDTEVTTATYPFGRGGYSIKKAKTKKRAVKVDVINSIRNQELEVGSTIWHHKNFFLLMFNWRGMNFIDLAFLRVENVWEGRLKYERRKTKDIFDIKLTEEALQILKFYTVGKKRSQLLFPIIDDIIDCGEDEYIRKTVDGRLKIHNQYLNKIGKLIGLKVKMTSYVVRHSFASISLHNGVSKSMIGDMLGHESYITTETYLEGFEVDTLDAAAELAINATLNILKD